MGPKNEDDLQNVPDTEFDDRLRGVIIDEDHSLYYKTWILGGITAIVLCVAGSWAYLFLSRTAEEKLNERLANRQLVMKETDAYAQQVDIPDTSGDTLRATISDVLTLAQTPLRDAANPLAPHIPQRQRAILVALKGLLRLDIEGFLDFRRPQDLNFFREQLLRIGVMDVEYYDSGNLKKYQFLKEGLIQRANYLGRYDENELDGFDLPIELSDRKGRLKADEIIGLASEGLVQLPKGQERFFLLNFFISLGNWYRHYNEMGLAQECYEMGRRYLDGYAIRDRNYKGFRPQVLNAFWEEYVRALDGLIEINLSNKMYRQARIYLAAMFKVPIEDYSLSLFAHLSEQLHSTDVDLADLRNDIKVVKAAIEHPENLSSFPLYNADDKAVSWEKLLDILRIAGTYKGKNPQDWVWQGIPPELQHEILANTGSAFLTAENKGLIIGALNRLVQSPIFYKQIDLNAEKISQRSRAVIKKASLDTLEKPDYQFLNRDILDVALEEAIDNPYVLHDGTRLDNFLSLDRTKYLVLLYNQEIELQDTLDSRRQELSEKIAEVQKGAFRPTFADLKGQLQLLMTYYSEQANINEKTFDMQRAILTQVFEEIEGLELQRDAIDVDRVLELRNQQDLAQNLQIQAKVQFKQAQNQFYQLEKGKAELEADLNSRLTDMEAQLEGLVRKSSQLGGQFLGQHGQMLAHLEKQLQLHKQYLDLLEGLKGSENNQSLSKVKASLSDVELKIRLSREDAAKLAGNEKEDVEIEIARLESERNRLLERFHAIYDPLQHVVSQIAEGEDEIWESEKTLHSTRMEIIGLVGTENVKGLLQKKTQRRAQLLLMSAEEIEKSPNYSEELRKLNIDIAEQHARLQVLLQTEEMIRTRLETFFPYSGPALFHYDKERLGPLRAFLESQDALYAEYETLWKKKELTENVYYLERRILTSFERISTALGRGDRLSEPQVNELSRVMTGLVEASSDLNRSRRLLKRLEQNPQMEVRLEDRTGAGYILDSVDLYQLEQQMGIFVNEYKKVFEERSTTVTELNTAIEEKNTLESDQIQAARERDQTKIDLILPRIGELEGTISALGDRELRLNVKLDSISKEYISKLSVISKFREQLNPKIDDVAKRLSQMTVDMAALDEKLDTLSLQLFETGENVSKQITALEVSDLDSLDDLIGREQATIQNLNKAKKMQLSQSYYRARSLWYTAKSFFSESELKSFEDLLRFNLVEAPLKTLADTRYHLLYDEFDVDVVYGQNMLGAPGTGASAEEIAELDDNRANYQFWVNQLQGRVLDILSRDLSKYVFLPEKTDPEALSLERRQEENLKSYMAYAHFLTAQVHMRRGLEHIRTAAGPVLQAGLAREDFDLAASSFISFVDFVWPYTQGLGEKSNGIFAERFFDREFPGPSTFDVNLRDQAKVQLAIISALLGDHIKAIDQLKEILVDIAKSVPTAALDRRNRAIFDVADDVLDLSQYQYESGLDPHYASLLAQNPSSHEVLFRIARSYQALAQEALLSAQKTHNLDKKINDDLRDKGFVYAKKAVGYLSQLILTQSYSPLKKAGLLQRAKLYRILGRLDSAKRDLVELMATATYDLRSLEYKDLTLQGDLPGEIDPPRTYVAFELGQLAMEQEDFEFAARSFAEAKRSDGSLEYVIEAKFKYAQSLKKEQQLVEAALFLRQLIDESRGMPQEYLHLYPQEAYLEYGDTLFHVGSYKAAIDAYEELFSLAPSALRVDKGLDLRSKDGMALLESDFRDAIRLLSLASAASGRAYLMQNDFGAAKEQFRNAQTLMLSLPWKEDKQMRKLTKEEYSAYREQKLQEIRWGLLKTDAIELLYSTYGDYRRLLNQKTKRESEPSAKAVFDEIDKALKLGSDQNTNYTVMLKRLDDFREVLVSALPETKERERVLQEREKDKEFGAQKAHRYEILVGLRDFILEQNSSGRTAVDILVNLSQAFLPQTIEYSMLDRFVLAYAPVLNLDENDRAKMAQENTNLDNLHLINDANSRLKELPQKLLAWLENEIRATGLDDIFIPVSEEAHLLPDIDRFRASVLAHLDTAQDYATMCDMALKYLEASTAFPQRLVEPSYVWEIVEIASLQARYRQDYENVETFTAFLLSPPQQQFFVQKDKSDMLRAKLHRSEALKVLVKDMSAEVATMEAGEEKDRARAKEGAARAELLALLQELSTLKGQDTDAVAMRVRAKELLEEDGSI